MASGPNQGIPTLCTGWSHKYEELLADYNLPGNLLNPLNPGEAVTKITRALTRPAAFAATRETIDLMKRKSEEMWEEVVLIRSFFVILYLFIFTKSLMTNTLW